MRNNTNVKFLEFEPFSINNIKNRLFIDPKVDSGQIIFWSRNDIDELHLYGLYYLIDDCMRKYQGLDMTINIQKGYINKTNATVKIYDKNVIVDNTVDICEFNLDEVRNGQTCVVIEYRLTRRYDKSNWWRLLNKRYQDIGYNY